MVKGNCNCGAVSFEIRGEVTDVYICHCSICRRSTGSTGVAVAIVSKKDFKWSKGKNKSRVWSKPQHDWKTRFCVVCGSSVPGENDKQHMYVPVGLLSTDTSALKVVHHLYVGSKASWEDIGDSGKQHIESFIE